MGGSDKQDPEIHQSKVTEYRSDSTNVLVPVDRNSSAVDVCGRSVLKVFQASITRFLSFVSK